MIDCTLSTTKNIYWPLLLKNYYKMYSFYDYSKLISIGMFPFSRCTKAYVKNGIINLDKPNGFNNKELLLWIKNFLNISKIAQNYELETNVSGCVIIFLENTISLLKKHIKKGKKILCVLKLSDLNSKIKKNLLKTVKTFHGLIFQSSTIFSSVKRQIKIKNIYSTFIVELDAKRKTCILEINCEINTHIGCLSNDISINFKNNCKLLEIRQINSGYLSEHDNLITLHELLDCNWLYIYKKNNFYLKKIIMPLEILLTSYKRIVVKNSSVNSICYGAKLINSGIIRIDSNITKKDEVVLITIKGEAIAIGISEINSFMINNQKNKIICIIKQIIMKKDTYPKMWGIGIRSVKKNLLISSGFLFNKIGFATKNIKNWNF